MVDQSYGFIRDIYDMTMLLKNRKIIFDRAQPVLGENQVMVHCFAALGSYVVFLQHVSRRVWSFAQCPIERLDEAWFVS